MRKLLAVMTIATLSMAVMLPVQAGTLVTVTATGTVEFNQIRTPPLGDVTPGDAAVMTFVVDSDIFTDSGSFPTRGYHIEPASFTLTFDILELELMDPFPAGQTPYFVIRDNDPAVDGFFVSTNVDFPVGVPINQDGIFGPFVNNYSVTYTGDTLPSLDILDALGTYDFDGLTVFNWTIDDGPFNAMFIVFEQMTIEPLVLDEDGDGIPDDDDLCAGTVIPEAVPTVRLGVNRWALVDGDGVFDTTMPEGAGPVFHYDLEDTAGCSCAQIIDMLGLGNGHERFGCSNSAMMEWSAIASGAGYAVTAASQDSMAVSGDRLAD